MKKVYRFFVKLFRVSFLVSLTILPVFFLQLTRDFSDTNKWFLFVLLSALTLAAWSVRALATGRIPVGWSGAIFGAGILTSASFLSLTIASTNKLAALTNSLGSMSFFCATILLFFGTTIVTSREKLFIRVGMSFAAAVMGLFAIYQFVGLGKLLPAGSPFASATWSPTGSPFALFTFLAFTLPVTISIAIGSLKDRKEMVAGLAVVASILTIAGIFLTGATLTTSYRTTALPLLVGAGIVKSSWVNVGRTIFGVGPENFLSTFTLLRPLDLTLSPLWNLAFLANASLVLHIAVSMGLVGVFSLAVFFIALLRTCWESPVLRAQAVIAILFSFFAPPTFTLFLLIMLLVFSSDTETEIDARLGGIGRFVIAGILLIVAIGMVFVLFRWHTSERLFYSSLVTARSGNGTKTYMLQDKAVKLNPTNFEFRIAISQTSLALAGGILAAAPVKSDGSPTLSEDDKTLLTDLITTAIRQGKAAVTLAPSDVRAWMNLAQIYQSLIGLAKDADTWAIAAYQKAFVLDPTNPVLRINLGGLYLTLGRTDEAGQAFLTAILLKPNYLTGFYNLAEVFRQKGDFDNAIKALEQARILVLRGSADEAKLEEEIKALVAERRTKGQTQTPSGLVVPELKLPN